MAASGVSNACCWTPLSRDTWYLASGQQQAADARACHVPSQINAGNVARSKDNVELPGPSEGGRAMESGVDRGTAIVVHDGLKDVEREGEGGRLGIR